MFRVTCSFVRMAENLQLNERLVQWNLTKVDISVLPEDRIVSSIDIRILSGNFNSSDWRRKSTTTCQICSICTLCEVAPQRSSYLNNIGGETVFQFFVSERRWGTQKSLMQMHRMVFRNIPNISGLMGFIYI